ncbi:MAG TPA: DNA mismatch repair protein MutL, partial [Saccharofermentans sp.]|nr:DNA mismatch repair protein MutL [Saccharofermentans sp.]
DRWFASIASAACKAAIKAHDRIDEQEVISLINQLSKLKDPYHCPHGRPTFIRQSISDFEKMFKRIV